MAWNKNLPADATKLRLSAGIIRSNWDAIETGLVPYAKLKLARQAANPTRQNNFGWIFTKNPGTGFSELYYEDDRNPASVIQLTSAGVLGSSSTAILTTGITFSGKTQVNNQTAIVSAWAQCQGTASGFAGFAYNIASCNRTATGEYTIKTTNNFINGSIAFIGTTKQIGSSTPGVLNWLTKSFSAGVVTITCEIKNRNGQHDDAPFDIMILGGI